MTRTSDIVALRLFEIQTRRIDDGEFAAFPVDGKTPARIVGDFKSQAVIGIGIRRAHETEGPCRSARFRQRWPERLTRPAWVVNARSEGGRFSGARSVAVAAADALAVAWPLSANSSAGNRAATRSRRLAMIS